MHLQQLAERVEVINVDESGINSTSYVHKSWSPVGSHHVEVAARRLNSYNVVAAISSKGRSWFVVGNGSNNSLTFLFFLLRVCAELQEECPEWRKKVLFQLDNAPYHRAKVCLDLFSRCAIPVFF
jgi:hypothetical protein